MDANRYVHLFVRSIVWCSGVRPQNRPTKDVHHAFRTRHEATSNMKLQNGTCGRTTCSSPVLRYGVLPPDGIHHSSETRHTKIQLWCSKAGVIAFPPPQTSDGNTLGQLCRCRCRCPRSRALAALHTLHPLCAEVLALVCRFLLSFEGQHVHFVQLRLVP